MPTYIRVKDLANAATTPATDDFILLSGAANGARKISRADFLTAVAGFYTADPSTYKLATLDAGDKVLVSQLPSSAFSYKGTWAASTNTPTLANGTGTAGDTYYASDSGSVNFGAGSISFLAGDAVVYDGTIWQKVPDVVNLLDGKGTLDEAKTTLEIPDVGTAPNETPLNQHLGSLAYADADSVSVAELQVESTTGTATTQALTVTDGATTGLVVQEDGKVSVRGKVSLNVDGSASWGSAEDYGKLTWDTGKAIVRGESGKSLSLGSNGTQDHLVVDTSGKVGIGTASPGSYNAAANNLVVGSGSGAEGITIATGTASAGSIYFADGTSGSDALRGYILYQHSSNELRFGTNGNDRWTINSTGNLVAGANLGIDFGSTTTGVNSPTVENGLLDDYEEGRLVVTATPSSSGTITLDTGVDNMSYTKVGRKVSITGVILLSSVSSPVGNYISISLPFEVANLNNQGGSVAGSCFVFNATGNSGQYSIIALEAQTYLRIYKNTGTGSVATAADFTGNESIYIGLTYFTD